MRGVFSISYYEISTIVENVDQNTAVVQNCFINDIAVNKILDYTSPNICSKVGKKYIKTDRYKLGLSVLSRLKHKRFQIGITFQTPM